MAAVFTERSRRVRAATEALALVRGGPGIVPRATGIAESTIRRGLRELAAPPPLEAERTRRPGGGRKRVTDHRPTLRRDLGGVGRADGAWRSGVAAAVGRA
ncbi:MAG: hypothetical protein ABJA98_06995 [Acidobacteriota bacterium]